MAESKESTTQETPALCDDEELSELLGHVRGLVALLEDVRWTPAIRALREQCLAYRVALQGVLNGDFAPLSAAQRAGLGERARGLVESVGEALRREVGDGR